MSVHFPVQAAGCRVPSRAPSFYRNQTEEMCFQSAVGDALSTVPSRHLRVQTFRIPVEDAELSGVTALVLVGSAIHRTRHWSRERLSGKTLARSASQSGTSVTLRTGLLFLRPVERP